MESAPHFPSRPFLPWRGWGRGCRNVCSIFHSLREDVPGNRGRVVLWEAKWLSTRLGRGQAGAGGGLPDPAPPRMEREEYTFVSPVASPHKSKAGGGGAKVTGKAVSVEVLFANGVLVKCTLKCLRNQTHSQSGQDAAHGTAHAQRNGARHAKHKEATDRAWLLHQGLEGTETVSDFHQILALESL